MKKIVTIIGARPQFIKCAPVSKAVRKYFTEILVHTGQHYDANMSDVFFDELQIPKPDYHLNIGSGSHGEQTGKMLIEIEKVLLAEKPDIVLIYGDTNSTLAGALAAVKLHIPVAHVEAGLRSFNRRMPEEINRILADQISKWLFCPTDTAVKNLLEEGVSSGVYNIGDVMFDAVLVNTSIAEQKSLILDQLKLKSKKYFLATIHRAENTDDSNRLKSIFSALSKLDITVVLPLHPRTKKFLEQHSISVSGNIQLVEPVGYLDMLLLEKHSSKILTDSGGVQKEAYFMDVPCITLRDETEWVETVSSGMNILVGSDETKILEAVELKVNTSNKPEVFGDGKAAEKIAEILQKTA